MFGPPVTARRTPRRSPVPLLSSLAACAGVAVASACGPGAAPETGSSLPADSLRRVLTRGFEQGRAVDVAFVRAIPDSALRWAPTPEVRDFAQQVRHAVLDNARIVALGVSDEEPPSLGDTAVYLNDPAALERAVERSYSYVLSTLRELPDARFASRGTVFGRELPKWNVFLLALQHAEWTRGQLVPYFRIHGIDPPEWRTY